MQNSLIVLGLFLSVGSIFTIALVAVQTRRLKEHRTNLELS